ncbi:hydroxyethylthiazole kinase-like uncharacterized protein yjeF [Streptococcus saliviloxodontae]|uniref:Hydroxyethylthiazole kinase-like uncharacterized protein yjeF n=1 Tax=Streptococcus saliviloxodontae TaxID=1349416 RepID=A0ABS2PIY1_9STRE|nr:hydroxyethylthiazole kinase-like uncharacterized protein yjeF [Streptococcus saliviloxodontae]
MEAFDLVRRVVVERQKESHKGSYGRVMLVGGFYPYGGAIIMSALACVHSGAGLVTVATEQDNITALHSHLPEAMAFDVVDQDLLLENIAKADVILIGPGLGENSRASSVFETVLSEIGPKTALVIDGSALNLLAKRQKHTKISSEEISDGREYSLLFLCVKVEVSC